MSITFHTARLFDRYGIVGDTNEEVNRMLDHVRRSYKSDKAMLKVKCLSNPTYGITGITEVFVLQQTELAEGQPKDSKMKKLLVIDAPESPFHMSIVDCHHDSLLAHSKLLVTNNHLNYVANDYTQHPKTRCFAVDDFNRANKYGYIVSRHYTMVPTKLQQEDGLSVKLKPLYIEGCVPFGCDPMFGSKSYGDALMSANQVFITQEVLSHKFEPQSFSAADGRIFIIRSDKAGGVYALISGTPDKNFGKFISMTGIMDNRDRIEFVYSKQRAVDLDEFKLCSDFRVEGIVNDHTAQGVNNPEELSELFTAEQFAQAVAAVKEHEEKKAKKKKAKKEVAEKGDDKNVDSNAGSSNGSYQKFDPEYDD